MDVAHKPPERICVGMGSKGYWQSIEYPDPPLYCSLCKRLGHLLTKCNKAKVNQTTSSSVQGQHDHISAHKNDTNSERMAQGQVGKQLWRPIIRNGQQSEATVCSPTDEQDTNASGVQICPPPSDNANKLLLCSTLNHQIKSNLVGDTTVCSGAQDVQGPAKTAALENAHPVFTDPPVQKSELEHVSDALTAVHPPESTRATCAYHTASSFVDVTTVHPGAQNVQVAAKTAAQDDAHPVFGEIPVQKSDTEHVTDAPTVVHPLDSKRASCEGDQNTVSPEGVHVNSATVLTGNAAGTAIFDKVPPPHTAIQSTTACVSSANQSHGEPDMSVTTPGAEGDGNTSEPHTPHALNAAAPAWSPVPSPSTSSPAARADLQAQFAEILKDAPTEDTPPSTEEKRSAPPATPPERTAKPPPTTPRMSFADALQNKAKKGNMNRRRTRYYPFPGTTWLLPDDPETPRPGPSTQPE